MARYKCSKCPSVTMLVPKHDFCYACFKKNFFKILPNLSTRECRDIIDVLETQAGYEAVITRLYERIVKMGDRIPQKRAGTPIPLVSTPLLLKKL